MKAVRRRQSSLGEPEELRKLSVQPEEEVQEAEEQEEDQAREALVLEVPEAVQGGAQQAVQGEAPEAVQGEAVRLQHLARIPTQIPVQEDHRSRSRRHEQTMRLWNAC